MSVAEISPDGRSSPIEPLRTLPFPPITKAHILNCSYHAWYPRYRSLAPRSRLIPLPPSFLDYLRADGILLPPEDDEDDWHPSSTSSPPLTPPTSVSSQSDAESDISNPDPSSAWASTHTLIKETITALGGSVMPKLNWSAPKDACWISATNSMECRTANDIYLLLKSSDFVVHDLEQVFDGVVNDDDDNQTSKDTTAPQEIPYHLVLRRTFTPALNPALEFRCFVRSRTLMCLTQRDLNHYDFLPALVPKLRSLIQEFFDRNLKRDFPDEDFVFDVYVPGPRHERVWLIDVNPWAERTDPLLFSWREILEREDPPVVDEEVEVERGERGTVERKAEGLDGDNEEAEEGRSDDGDDESGSDEDIWTPEFRLVNRDDPEAYAFNTPRYSAHKLPKDVVDAGGVGEGGIREFLGRWRELERRQGEN